MHGVVRFYVLASAVVLILLSGLVIYLTRQDGLQHVVEAAETQNIVLAQSLANSVWPQISPYVTMVGQADGDTLRSRWETELIDQLMRSAASNLPVLKIKVYNLAGTTVYSSDLAQIGADKRDHPAFIAAAREGRVQSKYSFRERFLSFDGPVADRHVVESYLPIRLSGDSGGAFGPEIDGVFEIYADVTANMAHEESKIFRLLAILAIVFAVSYAVLFLVARSASKVIGRQYSELESKAAELEQALKAQVEYNDLHREFVAMASHEFRTPLTIIDGAAQSITRKIETHPTDKIHKRCSEIRQAVMRMTGLIDSTLSAEQLELGKVRMEPQPIDLPSLLTQVRDRQQRISPSYRLTLDLQDLPAEIEGDPRLLEQVFANLLSNAVKYSADCQEVKITGTRDGSQAVVKVRDCGIGVSPDELPRLFQRYFRARTSIGVAGTGIGLHIVKRFVEMHGGTVSADSIKGAGSVFTVRLPIRLGQERRPPAGGQNAVAAAA